MSEDVSLDSRHKRMRGGEKKDRKSIVASKTPPIFSSSSCVCVCVSTTTSIPGQVYTEEGWRERNLFLSRRERETEIYLGDLFFFIFPFLTIFKRGASLLLLLPLTFNRHLGALLPR